MSLLESILMGIIQGVTPKELINENLDKEIELEYE